MIVQLFIYFFMRQVGTQPSTQTLTNDSSKVITLDAEQTYLVSTGNYQVELLIDDLAPANDSKPILNLRVTCPKTPLGGTLWIRAKNKSAIIHLEQPSLIEIKDCQTIMENLKFETNSSFTLVSNSPIGSTSVSDFQLSVKKDSRFQKLIFSFEGTLIIANLSLINCPFQIVAATDSTIQHLNVTNMRLVECNQNLELIIVQGIQTLFLKNILLNQTNITSLSLLLIQGTSNDSQIELSDIKFINMTICTALIQIIHPSANCFFSSFYLSGILIQIPDKLIIVTCHHFKMSNYSTSDTLYHPISEQGSFLHLVSKKVILISMILQNLTLLNKPLIKIVNDYSQKGNPTITISGLNFRNIRNVIADFKEIVPYIEIEVSFNQSVISINNLTIERSPPSQSMALIHIKTNYNHSFINLQNVRLASTTDCTLLKVQASAFKPIDVLIQNVTVHLNGFDSKPMAIFDLTFVKLQLRNFNSMNCQNILQCSECDVNAVDLLLKLENPIHGKILTSQRGQQIRISNLKLIQSAIEDTKLKVSLHPIFDVEALSIILQQILTKTFYCQYCSRMIQMQAFQVAIQYVILLDVYSQLGNIIELFQPITGQNLTNSSIIVTALNSNSMELIISDMKLVTISKSSYKGSVKSRFALSITKSMQVMIIKLLISRQSSSVIFIDADMISINKVDISKIKTSQEEDVLLLTNKFLKANSIISVSYLSLSNINLTKRDNIMRSIGFKQLIVSNLKLTRLSSKGNPIVFYSSINTSASVINQVTSVDLIIYGSFSLFLITASNIQVKSFTTSRLQIKQFDQDTSLLTIDATNRIKIIGTIATTRKLSAFRIFGSKTANVSIEQIIGNLMFEDGRISLTPLISIFNCKYVQLRRVRINYNSTRVFISFDHCKDILMEQVYLKSLGYDFRFQFTTIIVKVNLSKFIGVEIAAPILFNFSHHNQQPTVAIDKLIIQGSSSQNTEKMVDADKLRLFKLTGEQQVDISNMLIYSIQTTDSIIQLNGTTFSLSKSSFVEGRGAVLTSINSEIDFKGLLVSNRSGNTSQIVLNFGKGQFDDIYLRNCSSSKKAGGALTINQGNFSSKGRMLFYQNKAPLGGALAYFSKYRFSFENLTFIRNQASANFSGFSRNYITNPQGIQITINQQTLRRYQFTGSNQYELVMSKVSIKSGQNATLRFRHLLNDQHSFQIYNSSINFLYEIYYKEWDEKILVDQSCASPKGTTLYLVRIPIRRKVLSETQQINISTLTINFTDTIRGWNDEYERLEITYQIDIKNCDLGDYLNGEVQCKGCPPKTYNLIRDHRICKECRIEYECKKGVIPRLRDGYWRQSNLTDEFEECMNKQGNCLREEPAICIEGNIGPLCETCDYFSELWPHRYFESAKYTCTRCTELNQGMGAFLMVITLAGFIILNFAFMELSRLGIQKSLIVVLIRRLGICNLGISGMTQIQTVYIKLLAYHLQILGTLSTLHLKTGIDSIHLMTHYSSKVSDIHSISFVCVFGPYLSTDQSISTIMLVGLIASLLAITGIYAFVFLLLQGFKFNKTCQIQVIFAIIYLYQYFLPKISEQLFLRISCRRITSSFWKSDYLKEDCFVDHANVLRFTVIAPLIVILDIIVPIVLYRQITFLNKDQTSEVQYLQKKMTYSILYKEYTSRLYYFELIKSGLKLLILLTINLLNSFPIQKILITVQVLVIYLVILFRSNPYITRTLYSLDVISQCVLINSLVLGIILNHTNSEEFVILIVVVMILTNLSYMGYLLLLIFKLKIQQLRTMLANIQHPEEQQGLTKGVKLWQTLKTQFKKLLRPTNIQPFPQFVSLRVIEPQQNIVQVDEAKETLQKQLSIETHMIIKQVSETIIESGNNPSEDSIIAFDSIGINDEIYSLSGFSQAYPELMDPYQK